MENEKNFEITEAVENPVEPVHTALTAVSAKKQAPRVAQAAPETPAAPDPQAWANERVPVCDVQFRPGSKIYFFDPGKLELKNGDHVIIDTARGAEYGYCVIGSHKIARRELVQPLRRVLRVATAIDERIKADNERREKEAYAFCQRKIEELGLDMQLVSAECAFDGSKLLFFFTAENRVDFRELVKLLASNFHTRIELRQIGVRDKAKMLGGLGICGRPFCCASFLDDFQPVSIKMAKTQNLSLNPTKISGTCGRLMCCLKYEQDAYEDLIKSSPKPESFVDTPDGRGTVVGVNLMKQSVNVRMEQDEEEVHCYRNSEICVLRSGKAKKTDPPIPADLAPISGRREESPFRDRRMERRLTVDPEELTEPESPETPEAPQPEPERQENRRGRRDQRSEQPRAEKSRPEKVEKPAPERKEEAPEAPGRRSRRGNRSPEREPEQPELRLQTEKGEKQPSRQQRRRQQQGKQEPKLPQPEQPKRPAPEKRPEDPAVPKPESPKKPRRRYYHNRKPKG